MKFIDLPAPVELLVAFQPAGLKVPTEVRKVGFVDPRSNY